LLQKKFKELDIKDKLYIHAMTLPTYWSVEFVFIFLQKNPLFYKQLQLIICSVYF
jgi:hypothetical protein